MKKFLTVILGLLLLITISHQQSSKISLPVSPELVYKINLSIKKLQESLKNFNTKNENATLIWRRVQLTKKYLLELNQQFKKYNNVIIGQGNRANGNKNIVIGNLNNIEGSNNWVFISKFTGKINGDLIINKYRIQIDKSQFILKDPRIAISYLDDKKNKKEAQKFYKKNRQFCKWGKWSAPTSKNYKSWNQYYGYDQFVKSWSGNKLSGNSNNYNPNLSGSYSPNPSNTYNPAYNQYPYSKTSHLQKEQSSSGKSSESKSQKSSKSSKSSKESGSKKSSKSKDSKSKSSKNSKDSGSKSQSYSHYGGGAINIPQDYYNYQHYSSGYKW